MYTYHYTEDFLEMLQNVIFFLKAINIIFSCLFTEVYLFISIFAELTYVNYLRFNNELIEVGGHLSCM